MAAPTSAQALLACFNSSNPDATPAVASDVTFGTPQVVNTNNRNTKIKITATATAPFQGNGDYFYNRLKFSVLNLTNLTALFNNAQNKKIKDLVAAINTQNNTAIAEADVDGWNNDITETQLLDGVVIALKAKATSLAWEGSSNVTLASMKPQLTTVFSTNILNGITIAQATG